MKKSQKIFYPCPICFNKKFISFFKVSIFPVSLCADCGLVCLNPRMDEHSYAKYYRSQYYQNYNPFTAPATSSLRSESIYKDLSNYIKKDDCILEIGSGNGENLALLKKYGYKNLYGIEPSSDYRATLPNDSCITVYNKTLDSFLETRAQKRQYHCIIMSHVLEHFVEPNKALAIIASLLAPTGIVYIKVPNFYGFPNPFSQFTIPHVFYFSKVSLTNLLHKNYFTVKSYLPAINREEVSLIAVKALEKNNLSYSREEYKKAVRYFKKNKALYAYTKCKDLIHTVIQKLCGEECYLTLRNVAKYLRSRLRCRINL